MDYWQLISQINKTIEETGGAAPQSPYTEKPITITTTNLKTGQVTRQTIPAGTSVKSIEKQARERLASQYNLNTSQFEKIQDAPSFEDAQRLAAEYDVSDEELKKIYKGEYEVESEAVTPRVTIGITQDELDQIAQAEATGQCVGAMRAYFTPKTYRVRLSSGEEIYVDALSDKTARQKAEDEGYIVTRVSKMFAGEEKKEKKAKVSDPVRAYIEDKGADWKDEYKVEDGYNLVLMYEDSVTTGAKFRPTDLEKLFGQNAVDDTRKLVYGNVVLPDGLLLNKDDFNSLPSKYQDILVTEGYSAFQVQFNKDTVELGDGQRVTKEDWEELKTLDETLGTNYTKVGLRQGYDEMKKLLDADEAEYQAFRARVDSGEIIALPDGKYIEKEEFDKISEGQQQILKEGGFEALEEIGVTKLVNINDPSKIVTKEEYKQLVSDYESKRDKLLKEGVSLYDISSKIGHNPANEYVLTPESTQRLLINIGAMIAPPARAALPEYTIKDIQPIEWAFAATNVALIGLGFAPGAILGSTLGKVAVTGLSAGMSGLISYETAKNWKDLSKAERGLGVGFAVLCALPLMTTVARNVKIKGSEPIPTVKGDVVAWKGLSVAGQPIIGRSNGRWVLGTRNLTLPEASLILNGYHPEMMLETKVFVNRNALAKAGFSKTQIDYLVNTLKSRNLFTGKRSPWLSKEALIEPTQRLTAEEIDILMKHITTKKGQITEVNLLFGSPTIKAQAAPELRAWRAIHDWDIRTSMNQAATELFTKNIFDDLKAKGGGKYRINPKVPTLIEKEIGGSWKHIADIHALEEISASAIDLPTSKLDVTKQYSYGKMVSEPSISVNYPGIGKVEIMALSESGVRKADTLLRVRQTKQWTPLEKYVATGGYEYGQELINHLAATYDIPSLPVEKISFWTRLKNLVKRADVGGYYRLAEYYKIAPDDWITLATARIELAPNLERQGYALSRVALHELTHHQLIKNGIFFEEDVLGFLSRKPAYKTTFDFVNSLPKDLQAVATNVGDEFLCINLVKKMSGWYHDEYIDLLLRQLKGIGATSKQANSMLKLSQMYVDTIKFPHKVPIDDAWFNFVQGATPKYSMMLQPTTAFLPPERGIARIGVPKDAADFYVILRTYEPLIGEGVADKWLRSWAKAMGYLDEGTLTSTRLTKQGIIEPKWPTKMKLKSILPKLRAEMLEVASQTPSNMIGYRFTPAKSTSFASGASPSIVIHIPSSLGASVSPSLERKITDPIYPYKVSADVQPYTAQAISALVAKYPSLAPSVAAVSPSPSPTLSGGVSVPSYIVKPEVSISPKPSPGVKDIPSPSVMPSPSVTSIPPVSIVPYPPPSPSPYPIPYYPPPPEGGRQPPIIVTSKGKKYYIIPEGSIAWRQGSLKVKGELRPHWKYIPPPWDQEKPISLFYPPKGALRAGENTPEKTIQMIGKPKAKVPKSVSVDLGVVDIFIDDYGQTITYKGKGLETVVGKSIAGATKGMSIPGISPMRIKKRKNGHRKRSKLTPTLSTARR